MIVTPEFKRTVRERRRANRLLFEARPMPDADTAIESEARADRRFHVAVLVLLAAVIVTAIVIGGAA